MTTKILALADADEDLITLIYLRTLLTQHHTTHHPPLPPHSSSPSPPLSPSPSVQFRQVVLSLPRP